MAESNIKDIESGIELTKNNKTEFETNKTPSLSNGKEITNCLLHPSKQIHSICTYIHHIQNCICKCLHNEWLWRLSPCLVLASSCYYIITKIDILENKYTELQVVPYYLILELLCSLPGNYFTKQEYILFITKVKTHNEKCISQVISLIKQFRLLSNDEKNIYTLS